MEYGTNCTLTNKDREEGLLCRSIHCKACNEWRRIKIDSINEWRRIKIDSINESKFKIFIACIHQTKTRFEQIPEEENLKTRIAQLLKKEGYKFIISDE